jgi:hypothetical protein
VDELLTLALALNVWPVHLLVPPDDQEQPYQVAPKYAQPAQDVRDWVRGYWVMPGGDGRKYGAEMPADEHGKWIEGLLFPVRGRKADEEAPDGR